MSMSILSARYVNPQHTAASFQTEEFGDVLLSMVDTPDAWQAMLAMVMPVAYAPPPLSPADVDAFRDGRLAAGYADVATGKTWQCDDRSQGKWTAIGAAAGLAIVMGTTPAPSFDLIPIDNDAVTLSAADAFALINGRLLPWVSATMLYARSLKDQIEAGNPPADIAAGWP